MLCLELHLLKLHVSSLNIFIWGVVICSHAACMDFTGLMVVRFVFGICEGSVTAGFLVVSSMFYTRNEQTSRVGYCRKDCNRAPFAPLLTL
jgi:MFS family permease